jgi:hypothetical protein
LKNLVLSSFILFLVCSCSLSHHAIQNQDSDIPDLKPVFWFQCDTGHFLFNAKIHLLKNNYNGIIVIRCFPDDVHRIVFINTVGLKIFDIEHTNGNNYVIHYLLEVLNRKGLVKTLKNDLDLLLMNRLKGINPQILQKKSAEKTIFKYANAGQKFYLTLSDETGIKQQVIQKTGLPKKVRVDYYGNKRTGIDSVNITHYHFRLSIEMIRILEDYAAE